MRKIIIICTILLVAILVLAGKYFATLAGKDDNVIKVLNHFPADAALLISFKNDDSFYEIFKDFELFNAIIGESHQEEIKSVRETLLTSGNLSEATFDKNIFLTFHPSPGQDSLEFIYSINLSSDFSQTEVVEGISTIEGMKIQSLSQDFYQLEHKNFKRPLYAYIQTGLALSSFSKELVAKCVNKKTTRLSQEFVDEINKASSRNQNSPVNLFINHKAVAEFLRHFMKGKHSGNSSLLTDLRGFSSLSMNYKSDALMFNGISNVDSLTPSYLNLFLGQQGVPNQIKKILPENTSNFIAFGFSDLRKFQSNLTRYFKEKGFFDELDSQLKSIQASSGINVDRDIKPLLDKEFVVVENSYGERFAIIKVTNGRSLNFKLQLISSPLNDIVSQLNYSDILYNYYGDPLKQFARPYFTIEDNYLIVANTPGIIRNYLSVYQSDNFLSNTEAFKRYDQLVANKSNVLYFASTKKSKAVIKRILKPQYFNTIAKGRLQNFYGISYQWTAEDNHFFTNLYLSYNSSDSLALISE